jgi:hypothetical protein
MQDHLSLKSLILIACLGTLHFPSAFAEAIEIANAGLEEPGVADVKNVSFDGTYGGMGKVSGWSSNEPSRSGIIRVDAAYPGRTGNNVMYLHGSADQNFHSENFDLGEELQSDTTYVLSFDVLRWKDITKDDTVLFRAGLYTGENYESRVALKQFEGSLRLVDKGGNPADKVTVTLVYTSGTVEPGTRFWIGGDLFANSQERHRPHFDNFSLQTETR